MLFLTKHGRSYTNSHWICRRLSADRQSWTSVGCAPETNQLAWRRRPVCPVQLRIYLFWLLILLTRHRASTSMYSLTCRVRVATPAQYGRNGTASLQMTLHTQQARRFHCWCVRACVVRSACAGPGGLPLGSATHFHNVAVATHPVHRLQIRPIVHN